MTFLKENGFSVVRLYVAWPGLEPSKGSYNSTYLDVRACILIYRIAGIFQGYKLSWKDLYFVGNSSFFAAGMYAIIIILYPRNMAIIR